MTAFYLDHSGFAVDTGARWLVFDYYTDTPKGGGLGQGVINPAELAGKPVFVFASHRHHDHFNPVIFRWRERLAGVTYLLSSDIETEEPALFLAPHQSCETGGIRVETLESTDEGVAFLVEADGYRIYHAGDLNDWYWAEESEEYRREMSAWYAREMARLRGRRIDLAFVPADPRLGDAYWRGLAGLLREAEVSRAVPMHFWNDFSVMDRLAGCRELLPFRERLCLFRERGARLELP